MRCDPTKDSATTKETAGVYNESWKFNFSDRGGYNRWWIDSWNGDGYHFELGNDNDTGGNGFLSGQTYYFERWGNFGYDANNWAVYFFDMVDNNVTGNTDAWTSTFCRKIEGHAAGDFTNGLFEFVAPQTSSSVDVVWHKVILVRMNDTSSIGWTNKEVQGPTCTLTTRNNVVKSSGADFEQSYSITDVDRLHFFANYFNKQTDGSDGGVCVADGSTTRSALTTAWTNVIAQYPLKESVKHQFKIAEADQYGSAKTQAAARYDYILFRHGDEFSLSDFAERKTGGHYSYASVSVRNPLQIAFGEDSSVSTIIIIIASSVSLLSITALSVLLVKKRKKEQPN